MTYRGQLFIVLLSLVVITTGLMATASYAICNHLLRREVHRKVHSIAATTVLFLDPELVEDVAESNGRDQRQYALLKYTLDEVREANRRQDIWIDHIFILVPARNDSQATAYSFDTAVSHHPGELYEINGVRNVVSLEQIHRLDNQLEDFQVSYDTAFAPIYDHSGKLIAELGIKLGWAPNTMLGNVWRFILPPSIFTIGLAIFMAIILSREVTVPLYSLRETIDAIRKGDLNAIAEQRGTEEFRQMARAINLMTEGLRERNMIEKAFSGYESPEMLEKILHDGKVPELKGERRRLSVLFADIRNFTSMAETRRPEDVVEQLGEFLGRMVAVVQRNHGYVDKFLGDGMMVTFGAPVEDSDHEEHAIVAALEMQNELRKLCTEWAAAGRSGFSMGIGINTGYMVVGNIGSKSHMEYTAIGDAVNLASRLQTATRDYDAEILVSEETYNAVQELFYCGPLGGIHVKGRVQRVQVYSVDGIRVP